MLCMYVCMYCISLMTLPAHLETHESVLSPLQETAPRLGPELGPRLGNPALFQLLSSQHITRRVGMEGHDTTNKGGPINPWRDARRGLKPRREEGFRETTTETIFQRTSYLVTQPRKGICCAVERGVLRAGKNDHSALSLKKSKGAHQKDKKGTLVHLVLERVHRSPYFVNGRLPSRRRCRCRRGRWISAGVRRTAAGRVPCRRCAAPSFSAPRKSPQGASPLNALVATNTSKQPAGFGSVVEGRLFSWGCLDLGC